MFRVIDEIADAGCLWLLFTGGEIFARHDFHGDLHSTPSSAVCSSRCSPTARRSRAAIADYAGRMASVRHRDHALRPHARNLRAVDRRAGIVRSLHARNSPAQRAQPAAQPQDRRRDHQSARDPRHAAVRRGGDRRRLQVRRHDQRAHRLLAQPARACGSPRRRWCELDVIDPGADANRGRVSPGRARSRRRDARQTSINAAAASTPSPSIPRGR